MVSSSSFQKFMAVLFAFLKLIWSTRVHVHAFAPSTRSPLQFKSSTSTLTTTTSNIRTNDVSLHAYASKSRDTILRRNGTYFKLNRFSGKVEFGSTANLITTFDKNDANDEIIKEWLSDEKRIALSIWDEKLLTDLGNSVYRLQLMTLQFVTLQLAPSVDTRMWIEKGNDGKTPVFKLQSIDFDPNIELLPGINVSAKSLGIQIEVVGELRPSKDGKGVEGRIGFVSGGDLPPPMRLLPEPALKSASDLICKTVNDFAIMSFQNGARKKYKEFVAMRQKQKQ